MRVALLADQPVDYAIAFANGLAPHARVTLIAAESRYAPLRRWIDPAVELRLVDWPRHRSLRNPAFLWRLTRTVRTVRPELLHLLSNTALWLNLAMPLWRGLPLLTTIHDIATHPGDRDTATLPAWAPRLMVRLSPDVVVHGPSLARLAVQRFAKSPERVHVLQHPAIRRYAELAHTGASAGGPGAPELPETGGNGFRLLLFGRIFAYKGLDLLVEAERLLGPRIPGLAITVAGRGDDPGALRPRMGTPGRYDIRNRFIPDAEVARLFAAADAVVLPYAEGSQSGVLHVAATFGKPLVATDVGELGATVARNRLGLVVPPGRADALAAALATLAEDRMLRAELGANALAWSRGANAPETVGRQALALYREILRR
ncbi:glycosyltransferase family 4 protein [Oceanicella sp. SM1341]|uniref:glycosyltransferase family 4 protein n=1 Tax=Oceanicella sp. SM1341 TaxID=1548889 RepID=UPI000E53E66E|nr:glycosyltransferase family 4 protein [Oceanicella sp. SM1341]